MKLAFFLLSLYALLGTHHARTLHGDVIQMVIEALEFRSLDQTTYGRVPGTPPTPSEAPTRGEGTYGRVKPKAPPSPSVATTYDHKDTNEQTGDAIEIVTGEQEFQSLDQTNNYGRVPKTPPPPSLSPSRGQETFGRVPKSPPPPSAAPSRGQGTYGRENPSELTYVRDNFLTTRPLTNDLTRVAPSAPTPPQPNVPSHPSLCVEGGNACSELFTSV